MLSQPVPLPQRWGLAKGMPQYFQGSGQTSFLSWEGGERPCPSLWLLLLSYVVLRAALVSRDPGKPKTGRSLGLGMIQREDGEESGTELQPTVRLQETLPQSKLETEGAPQGIKQWALLWWGLCGLHWVRIIIVTITTKIITTVIQ